MDEVERYQRRLHADARLQTAPSPGAFDRMRKAMLSRVDNGDRGPELATPIPAADSPDAPPSRRWIWWSLGAALAAAALAALWAGPRSSTRVVAEAHDASPMVGDDEAERGSANRRIPTRRSPKPVATAVVGSPASASVPATPTPTPDTPQIATPAPSRAKKPRGPAPVPPPPNRDVAGEAALMQSVQRALSSDDLAAAQRELRRYARLFPGGVLAPEAAAAKTIIDCRRKTDDAGAAATRYLGKHPSSPMAARIRRECNLAR